MRGLVNEPLKDMIKNNLDLYIICCIPVFPFCLSGNILLYLHMERDWKMGGFGNCMLMITGVLLLVCFAVFRYSLKAYIRQKSEKYSLLVMLGISNRDFFRILAKEYCPAFLVLLTAAAFGSNVISNLILFAIFRTISYDVILASVKMMMALILMFSLGMTGTLLILKWKQWRKDLICFFEKTGNGSEKLHGFRIAYGTKIYLAVFCFLSSFVLLYDYSVGRLFIAVMLHLLGIYFLLQVNERLVKKVFCLKQKRYYQKLLIWNDFISEYRMNGNLIYSIYAVNFLLVLVFGGLMASDFPEDHFYSGVKIIIAVVGLAIILEGQTIILERMILDTKNERMRYDVLFQLGIGKEVYFNLIQSKIKNMTVYPGILASVMGALFFLCDYIYQENVTGLSDLWSIALLKYAGAIVIFGLVQYGGYFFIQKRMKKHHEQFKTAIGIGAEG